MKTQAEYEADVIPRVNKLVGGPVVITPDVQSILSSACGADADPDECAAAVHDHIRNQGGKK